MQGTCALMRGAEKRAREPLENTVGNRVGCQSSLSTQHLRAAAAACLACSHIMVLGHNCQDQHNTDCSDRDFQMPLGTHDSFARCLAMLQCEAKQLADDQQANAVLHRIQVTERTCIPAASDVVPAMVSRLHVQ